jgi:hypothetical protein
VDGVVRDEHEAIMTRYVETWRGGGLGGLLVDQGPRVVGLIEGEEGKVLQAVERIATDKRHRNLRVLKEEPVAEPRFANLSYSCLSDGDPPGEMQEATSEFAAILALKL